MWGLDAGQPGREWGRLDGIDDDGGRSGAIRSMHHSEICRDGKWIGREYREIGLRGNRDLPRLEELHVGRAVWKTLVLLGGYVIEELH
ncbi:hypothetical protein NY08_139 [Rhodococcus sp. B7740]|nr:hypothetical protein NY08_139 [Rhodococcus sp. B7740]